MNIFEEKTDSELLSYFSDYQKLCSLDKYTGFQNPDNFYSSDPRTQSPLQGFYFFSQNSLLFCLQLPPADTL